MEISKMEFWRAEIIFMVTQMMSEALVRRIYNHVSRIYALHNDGQQRKKSYLAEEAALLSLHRIWDWP